MADSGCGAIHDRFIDEYALKFPGALSLVHRRFGEFKRDRHSLVYGEVKRLRMTQDFLRKERARLAHCDQTDEERHDVLLRAFHRYYVGLPTHRHARHARMYRGTPADYDDDLISWREACGDVEGMYDYLIERLPRYVTLDGQRRDLKHLLRRPDVLRETWDPIHLLDFATAGGMSRNERIFRHFARQKLVFAQISWEFRRSSLNPYALEERSGQVEAFIKQNMFGGQRGERVHVVCELDAAHANHCRKWYCVEPGGDIPAPHHQRIILQATRYYVTTPEGKRIPTYFFIRPKKHPLFKALIKRIRFLRLMGIGDGVAIKFVVEDDHLDELTDEVRRIMVRCLGQVCDQGSTIGERNGQPADPANRYSSEDHEVMKYVCMLWEEMTEFQFVPPTSWRNETCSHSRVNHDWYKLLQITADILPLFYPMHLFGVPWPCDFDKKHGMPSFNPVLWGEMVAHVLKRSDVF